MNILVANIGSTSFKYRLFAIERDVVLAQGRIERIGQPGGPCPDYETALRQCAAQIAGPGKPLASLADLDAIGFKAVHAGPLGGARLVDDAVLGAMEEFTFFAPAHNPPYIAAMRSFRRALPHVPLVALFETAFFDRVPESATTYAVPYAWKAELGVRRYGFHGASHRAASERAQAILGRGDLRHVSCHLGGSSSVAAIRRELDTALRDLGERYRQAVREGRAEVPSDLAGKMEEVQELERKLEAQDTEIAGLEDERPSRKKTTD